MDKKNQAEFILSSRATNLSLPTPLSEKQAHKETEPMLHSGLNMSRVIFQAIGASNSHSPVITE